MKSFLAVGIGGFFGAIFRYGLSLLLPNTGGFPAGTLIINLAGCFCLAWLFTTFTKRTPLVVGIGTGFFGAFTTFSTFSLETMLLLEHSKWLLAISYSFASLIGGLCCAILGIWLAKGHIQ